MFRDAEQEEYFNSLIPLWESPPHSRGKVGPEGSDGGPPDPSGMLRPSSRTRGQAKRLRRIMTDSEAALWSLLRRKAIEGLRFRRQHPIGRYIVDFACLSRRLVVEVDGSVHRAEFYDVARAAEREAWITAQGFRVLRLRISDVLDRAEFLLDEIRNAALGERGPLSEG